MPPSTFESPPRRSTPLFGRSRNQENLFENSTNDPFSFPNRTFRFGGENTLNFNDSPVRIRPSIRQIRNSTRILQYRDISSNQTICPIRRDRFEREQSVMQILHCRHVFDELSLRRHFRFSARCPMCRYDIRDYELDNISNSTTYSTRYNTEPLLSQTISQESRDIINNLNTAVETALRNTISNQVLDISSVDLQYSLFFPSTDDTIDNSVDNSVDNTIDNSVDDTIYNSVDNNTVDDSIDDTVGDTTL